jgi:hypothetical protein
MSFKVCETKKAYCFRAGVGLSQKMFFSRERREQSCLLVGQRRRARQRSPRRLKSLCASGCRPPTKKLLGAFSVSQKGVRLEGYRVARAYSAGSTKPRKELLLPMKGARSRVVG